MLLLGLLYIVERGVICCYWSWSALHHSPWTHCFQVLVPDSMTYMRGVLKTALAFAFYLDPKRNNWKRDGPRSTILRRDWRSITSLPPYPVLRLPRSAPTTYTTSPPTLPPCLQADQRAGKPRIVFILVHDDQDILPTIFKVLLVILIKYKQFLRLI